MGPVLVADDLVGRKVLAVTAAWFVYKTVRSPSPDPVWLNMEGLGQVRCGCAGRGDVALALGDPAGFDMAEAGRVEVEPWDEPSIAFVVGSVVARVAPLVYQPHEAEVGFVLETDRGSVAIVNLADDLEIGPWPAERYRPLFDNTKRLRELVAEIEALSAQAVEQAEGWPHR